MILIIFLLLATALAHACPPAVKSELELIALPLPCFHQLYDSALFDGHRVARVINERLEVYRRMLQEIKMQDREHLQTAPVLKWAQSEGQIFVSFKLSHRQDSPTCSDIRAESFETSDVNSTEGDILYERQNSTDNNFSSFRYTGTFGPTQASASSRTRSFYSRSTFASSPSSPGSRSGRKGWACTRWSATRRRRAFGRSPSPTTRGPPFGRS